MLKLLSILAVAFTLNIAPQCFAEDVYFIVKDSKFEPVQKATAVKTLLNDEKANVLKCTEQEVNQKTATLRKK